MRPKLKEEGSPMESYVGLDVHSKRSVFVIEAEDGRVVARGDIPTTPAGFRQLRQQHELAAETPVALETGTVAFYAARELARVGQRGQAPAARGGPRSPQQEPGDGRGLGEAPRGARHGAGAADLRRPAPRPLALRAGADRGPGGDAGRPAGDDRQGRRAPADRAGGRSDRLPD